MLTHVLNGDSFFFPIFVGLSMEESLEHKRSQSRALPESETAQRGALIDSVL